MIILTLEILNIKCERSLDFNIIIELWDEAKQFHALLKLFCIFYYPKLFIHTLILTSIIVNGFCLLIVL